MSSGLIIHDQGFLTRRIKDRRQEAREYRQTAMRLRGTRSWAWIKGEEAKSSRYARKALTTLVDMRCVELGHIPSPWED